MVTLFAPDPKRRASSGHITTILRHPALLHGGQSKPRAASGSNSRSPTSAQLEPRLETTTRRDPDIWVMAASRAARASRLYRRAGYRNRRLSLVHGLPQSGA